MNGSKDVWTYRLVVSFIGLTALAVAVGSTFLADAAREVPPSMQILGTSSIVALAGLLPTLFNRPYTNGNGYSNGSPTQKDNP